MESFFTNLGLGTPDAAALIVRTARRWAAGLSQAPKGELDADVILPIDLEGVNGRAYRSTCLDAARLACSHLAAVCAAQWEPCETSIWQKCDDGWVASNTTTGGWQRSRATQVMFALGVEHDLRRGGHAKWTAG